MKTIPLFIITLFLSIQISGQSISINNNGAPPHPSAILDVSSTDKGMLIPRITSFPVNAAEGLLVYREDLKCFFFNDGSEWKIMEGTYTGGNGIEVSNDNEISLEIQGQVEGDMMCFDGTNWIRIPKGQEGDMMVIKDGVPQWEAATASNPNPPHYVGEVFGGGIVFWVDGSGEHGLIAAPNDQSSGAPWGIGDTHILVGANGDGIGAGAANTAAIVNAFGAGTYAAKIADDYNGGGRTDWYLPSLTELALLYAVRETVGGFTAGFYWTSTESTTTSSWCIFMGNGAQLDDNKWGDANVRAIRAF